MSGCTRAVPVRLTVKRRRKLEQIVAAGTSPQRLVLRATIVLAAPVRLPRDPGPVRQAPVRAAGDPRAQRKADGRSRRHLGTARWGIAVVAPADRRSSPRAGPGDLGGYRGPGAGRGQGPPAQGPRLAQPRRRPLLLAAGRAGLPPVP